MSLRSLLLLLVGVCVVVFIGVNWTQMSQPTELSLIFTSIHAPLGLVLLGIMVLLAVLFISLMAYTQVSVLLEAHRHAKELAAQRELAEKAEVSRFTELRAALDAEAAKLAEAIRQQGQELMARVDRAEMGLRARPVDEQIGRLAPAVEEQNRQLHARLDRLEMGLGERMSHLSSAPAAPANPPGAAQAEPGAPAPAPLVVPDDLALAEKL